MGAECWINNLHFHLLNTTDLFNETLTKFPIEESPSQVFLESTLKHKEEGEINMFSVGVRFAVTTEWPVKAFVVTPIKDEETKESSGELDMMNELEGSEPTESVAHAVGVILNLLIDDNIPHNLMIANQGETVYILPRKFDMLINAA